MLYLREWGHVTEIMTPQSLKHLNLYGDIWCITHNVNPTIGASLAVVSVTLTAMTTT
jgi:hypothetical protein